MQADGLAGRQDRWEGRMEGEADGCDGGIRCFSGLSESA